MTLSILGGITIGEILGAVLAWYLFTGTWAILPVIVVILGWRIGDYLYPMGPMNLTKPPSPKGVY